MIRISNKVDCLTRSPMHRYMCARISFVSWYYFPYFLISHCWVHSSKWLLFIDFTLLFRFVNITRYTQSFFLKPKRLKKNARSIVNVFNVFVLSTFLVLQFAFLLPLLLIIFSSSTKIFLYLCFSVFRRRIVYSLLLIQCILLIRNIYFLNFLFTLLTSFSTSSFLFFLSSILFNIHVLSSSNLNSTHEMTLKSRILFLQKMKK